MPPVCLAIETSCDETAAAVVRHPAEVLSSVVSSQYVHAQYGGVVPELAARAHMELLVPIVRQALADAGIPAAGVDLVCVTHTPGLLGALLTGLPFAKALAFGLNKPFVGVHHLEGHLFAVRLEHPDASPPFLAAVLSGGHTELLLVRDWCSYEELGSTLDDALGEAFDKSAKLLGLPYPGGAALEQLARAGKPSIPFPVSAPTRDSSASASAERRSANADSETRSSSHSTFDNRHSTISLDFSFSGLKTAVLYYLRDHPDADRADVAASFQTAAVASVVNRLNQAIDRTGFSTVAVSGGVAANGFLRERLADLAERRNLRLLIPRPGYCTDNAAMIGAAGLERFLRFGPSAFSLPAAARTPLH